MEHLDPRAVEFLEGWPLFDSALVEHHFTPYMRDYDVIVEASAAAPDGSGSYLEGRYRFRFTHCVVAEVTSTVGDNVWAAAWSEEYTDLAAWERAGKPRGYLWGIQWMDAYPGGRYLPDSDLAANWTQRLGHVMHAVEIETNAHRLRLVFHRLLLHRIAHGDPAKRVLTEIEPLEMFGDTA